MLQVSDRSHVTDDLRIAIIDPNGVRASEIRERLGQFPVAAEAVASITEIASVCGDRDIVLVHDHAGSVAQAVRWSMSLVPTRPVFAYSLSPTVSQVVGAMKAGASDYLEWPFNHDAIERIVEQASREHARSNQTRERQGLAKWAIERLSSREKEVLVALSQGLTSVQIAEDLAISPRTVETHRYNLRRKLGSIRTAEAIKLVFENGLGDTTTKADHAVGEGSAGDVRMTAENG